MDGANHTPQSLTRLINFAIGRQDLFYEALQIGDRANHWCHKISRPLLKAMRHDKDMTRASMETIWYSRANDGYTGGIDHQHYNQTRYHGINLHAFFTKGTVEFRLFNGTTHAGKIKAYILRSVISQLMTCAPSIRPIIGRTVSATSALSMRRYRSERNARTLPSRVLTIRRSGFSVLCSQ